MTAVQGKLFDESLAPCQPTVLDYQFVLYDDRTRPDPYGALVDAINTQKHGGMYHVKPSAGEAVIAMKRAAEWFQQSLTEPPDSQFLSVTYGAIWCLFAIQCCGRLPPVGLVHPYGQHSIQNAIERTKWEPKSAAVGALAAVAGILPNDDTAARKLAKARSQAWSADVPGIAILVDLQVV